MSKFKLSLLLAALAAFTIPAMAGEHVVKRVPAGAAAFHFMLDLTVVPAPAELVGYIAFIEGVDGGVGGLPFSGTPSKDTAYFTVRLTGASAAPVPLPVEPEPELAVSIIPPGAQFTIFYNASPSQRDWSDPSSFEQGVPIAVFEESALINGSLNVFSSRLIDSTPINFNGQRIDFKKLVPNGVTITNFGNDGFRFREYNNTVGSSQAATAIAIGGKLRGDSDDD
jgi:hypothetical protein